MLNRMSRDLKQTAPALVVFCLIFSKIISFVVNRLDYSLLHKSRTEIGVASATIDKQTLLIKKLNTTAIILIKISMEQKASD